MDPIQAVGQLALVSGLYTRTDLLSSRTGIRKVVVETVRLDVDGYFPQNLASGTFTSRSYVLGGSVDWIAQHLKETTAGVWEGNIVRRWRDTQLLPHTAVRIHVPRRALSVNGAHMT